MLILMKYSSCVGGRSSARAAIGWGRSGTPILVLVSLWAVPACIAADEAGATSTESIQHCVAILEDQSNTPVPAPPAAWQSPAEDRHHAVPARPRSAVFEDHVVGKTTMCDQYTVGVGWKRRMKLYLGQGARDYLPLIEEAARKWNDALGREVIQVCRDPVDYLYAVPLSRLEHREFYNDGASVIYFQNRDNHIGGYALSWHESKAGKAWEIAEADVFIWTRNRVLPDSRSYLVTTMHELGHALGLNHIPISGSIMSYQSLPSVINSVDPFIELGLLRDHNYNNLLPGEVPLFFSPDHKPLLHGLTVPSEQDKYALMCLYDFSDWEE